jgi:hypothetical protein
MLAWAASPLDMVTTREPGRDVQPAVALAEQAGEAAHGSQAGQVERLDLDAAGRRRRSYQASRPGRIRLARHQPARTLLQDMLRGVADAWCRSQSEPGTSSRRRKHSTVLPTCKNSATGIPLSIASGNRVALSS